MDTLSLRLFLRVAELGAINAAATDLSLSAASASARLAKLETVIGFRLFNRTTRALSLTTDGAAFLPYAQQCIETLDDGLNSISGSSPHGSLRMTMPGSFGRMHIVPLLAEFRSRFPLLQLDLRLSDEIFDVVEGGYDLIVRNAALADNRMVARKLAMDRRILVAAPAYLHENSHPSHPQALQDHHCVVFAGDTQWRFEDGQTVSVPSTISVDDGEAMRKLIESGVGIGVKSVWNAQQSLADGRLVEVLPDFPLVTESSIWALYPSNRIVPPKVRAMVDFLLEHFAPVPPWEQSPSKPHA